MSLLREHNEIVRGQATMHSRFGVKSQGDGFMLAFASAHNAVRCAIGIQRALAERDPRAQELEIQGCRASYRLTRIKAGPLPYSVLRADLPRRIRSERGEQGRSRLPRARADAVRTEAGDLMLRGDVIELRPVRDADLATLYELMTNLDTRGPYFPLGVMSEPAFRAAFAKHGFWDAEEGMLVMVKDGEIVGEIEYFPITHYLQGYEISYQLFGDQHAGRGYTSDAVRLLVGYVFGRKRVNRMQLNIHPGNVASKRVAQKCGFTFEGIMRDCWFHQGEYHDLEVWSILRDEAVALNGGEQGRRPVPELG